jgi:uncharacterized protein DUF3618
MTAEGPSDESAGRQAAEAVTSPDVLAEAGEQAKAGRTSPDDPQQLKEEIERTRDDLGETVQQLAAKTDVKAIARDKTAEVIGSARASLEPVRQVVTKGTSTAREYRTPLALAGASVILGSVAAWLRRQPQAGWRAPHADRRRR